MYSVLALVGLVLAAAGANNLEGLSLVCITAPPLELIAGHSNISASHENPFGLGCKAILRSSDSTFPPITYKFETNSSCPGTEITSFQVPLGMPNGEASVLWVCDKQLTACTSAVITDGQRDPSLSSEQNGTVDCILRGWVSSIRAPTSPTSTTTARFWNTSSTGTGTVTNSTSQVSSASRLSVPAIATTIVTVTRTITTLFTSTIATDRTSRSTLSTRN